jgi:biopolymer transport protein ExbD
MSAIPENEAFEPIEVQEEPKKKHRKSLGKGEPTMNLVAMLDLSFNILIFFIITANFAVHEGVITAKVPQIKGGEATLETPPLPKTELKILLTSGNGMDGQARITIENSPEQTQDFAHLTEVLARIQNNKENPNGAFNADNPVLITPDQNTRWQDVVNTFNAVVKARYSDVSFGELKAEDSGGGEGSGG